ncbi:Acidic mammalian chitinase [Aphelenchoides bicaudatus]|nr:Acidic mammalian chitinase [Aphelenchoides bicaudatus]
MKQVWTVFVLATMLADAEPIRGCYLTNWAQYRTGVGKFQITENYISGLCTHIFYAFASVDTNFQLSPTDPSDLESNGGYAQLQQVKQKDPQLKTLISIGGANFDTSIFASIASSQQNLNQFAQNSLAYAEKHGFNGVDIDWEYPTADQKTYLSSILQALKTASKGQFLVTAAVSAGISTIEQAYDLPSLKDAVDFLNVMTYDYHGSWNAETGINSPLNSGDDLNIKSTIEYYLSQGFSAQKLVLGIPTYARGWTLTSSQTGQGIGTPASGPSNAGQITQAAGTLAEYEVCQVLSQGAQSTWDEESETPYMQLNNQWYTYENETSIDLKVGQVKYAQQQQLAGVFVWTIDFDDFSASCSQQIRYPLLNAINKALI